MSPSHHPLCTRRKQPPGFPLLSLELRWVVFGGWACFPHILSLKMLWRAVTFLGVTAADAPMTSALKSSALAFSLKRYSLSGLKIYFTLSLYGTFLVNVTKYWEKQLKGGWLYSASWVRIESNMTGKRKNGCGSYRNRMLLVTLSVREQRTQIVTESWI